MAKAGLVFPDIDPILRDRVRTRGWALCVGAGTSVPTFPSWNTLVERLVARDVGDAHAHDLTKRLLERFNADALIQSASDRLRYSGNKFAEILTDELYRDIRSKLTDQEWKLVSNALSAPNPGDMTRRARREFVGIIRSHYDGLSSTTLAEIVSEIADTKVSPAAIISFNAEPLLFTLISLKISHRVADGSSKATIKGEQQPHLDMVTHGTSNRRQDRIPYFFCHGLLPVPDVHRRRALGAVDKLVFSEGNYLQLANSSFSWQSSVFIDVCAFHSVVFVGVSLSDPNMRRWLSWVHANRVQELQGRFGYDGPSTDHYWISRLPESHDEREWIEASVAHLGVRLVWIPGWSKLEQALRSMLGI